MHLKRSLAVLALSIMSGGLTLAGAAEDTERWEELRGVFNADFNVDGTRVIARLRSDEIGIWDVEQGTRVVGELGADARSKRYEMSSDHRFVLIGLENGARVFDAATAAAVSPLFDAHLRDQLRTAAVFSPDNNTVVIFEEKQISVWNTRSGKRVAAISGGAGPHNEAPASAIFTADGAHCFLMDPNGTVTRYETQSWKPAGKSMEHPRLDFAYEFAFSASADGKWIATFDDAGENGPKGQLQIWDASTSKPLGKPLVTVNGFGARFLADPPRVIVRPARGEATVRALPSMKTLYAIKPAPDEIDSPHLDVTADEKWILTWSSDRTLLALDATTGKTTGAYLQKAAIGNVLVPKVAGVAFLRYDNSTFSTEGFQDNYIFRMSVPELNVGAKFRSSRYLSEIACSPGGERLLVREGSDDHERLLILNGSDMSAVRDASEEE